MCFTTGWHLNFADAEKELAEMKVYATEDVLVYKVFNYYSGKYHSAYLGMPYEQGKSYERKLSPASVRKFDDDGRSISQYKITVGIHCSVSRVSVTRHFTGPTARVMMCVIPKGSLYYQHPNGDIVTSNLIFK